MKVTNKTEQVLNHLLEKGQITSIEAINMYGATRLSSIIFNLRKRGYVIENEWLEGKDRFGNQTRFVNYTMLPQIPMRVISKGFGKIPEPSVVYKIINDKGEELKWENYNY